MNCKYCGAEMLSNTKFCIKCGKNNDDASEKVILVVRRHIVVGANRILFSVYPPIRLCRIIVAQLSRQKSEIFIMN
jgi:predicted amidophosphoribosyltransferase